MDQRAPRPGGRHHGLILGKFLPFHHGHRRLIERALAECEVVTVAVFSRDAEPFPGDVRADWIRRECTSARVVHAVANYPDPWDEESWEYWVTACRTAAPEANRLYTSEAYGDELSGRIGIAHVLVDPERTAVPVSGMLIRQDPIAHWRFVPDAVRPWLVKKIAVVGAESTGKTTLAERLARRYGTAWVPEYGRYYCEKKAIEMLTPDDLLAIAQEQAGLEERLAVESNGLLICDTDLMVTRAWCRHLCGTVHPGIAEVERLLRYDLHLLTNIDVPWANDGTRVCGDPDVRAWFHHRYVTELAERRAPHMLLPPRKGDAFALACNIIETLWPAVRAQQQE